MNPDKTINFFSAPGKIRLKPLLRTINNKTDKNKIVNNYIIIQFKNKDFTSTKKFTISKTKTQFIKSSNKWI